MSSQTPPALSTILSAAERRRVAVAAGCDPQAVSRYEKAAPMRSTTVDRVEKALRNLGLEGVIERHKATAASR